MAIQRKRISQCIRSINSVFFRFSVNTYASSLFMPVVIDVTCNFLIMRKTKLNKRVVLIDDCTEIYANSQQPVEYLLNVDHSILHPYNLGN